MGTALAALFSFVLTLSAPAPLPFAPGLGPVPFGASSGEIADALHRL